MQVWLGMYILNEDMSETQQTSYSVLARDIVFHFLF